MHKNRENSVSPLQGNGDCTILYPEQTRRPGPLFPEGCGGALAMVSASLGRGRALCSGCFSFGAACGVLWILRSSDAFVVHLLDWASVCFTRFPYLSSAAALCVWPVIFILMGRSPAGHFFVCLSVAAAGFASGCACALAFGSRIAFSAALCLLPVFSSCIVSAALSVILGSRLLRRKLSAVSGGRQDTGYFLSQLLLSCMLLALSAATLGVFISNL